MPAAVGKRAARIANICADLSHAEQIMIVRPAREEADRF